MDSSTAFNFLMSKFIQFWSDIIKCPLCVENMETEDMLPSGGWLQYNGTPHYLDIVSSHLLNPSFSFGVVVCSSAPLNLRL